MNVVPRRDAPPQPRPEPESGPSWLTNIVVVTFVALSLTAVAAHVLEDSHVVQWLREFMQSAQRTGTGIVEQYTRFRTESIDGGEIVTGYRYASSSNPRPALQYCYIEKAHSSSGVKLHIELAKKAAGAALNYMPVSPDVAGQFELSVEALTALARERCRFDEWE